MIAGLLHVLGIDDVSGRWYAFWSGFGGDLTIFGALAVWLRHQNCHVQGCPRIGRHQVAGTEWKVCRHHHPDDAPTAKDAANGGLRINLQPKISDEEAAQIKAKWLTHRNTGGNA